MTHMTYTSSSSYSTYAPLNLERARRLQAPLTVPRGAPICTYAEERFRYWNERQSGRYRMQRPSCGPPPVFAAQQPMLNMPLLLLATGVCSGFQGGESVWKEGGVADSYLLSCSRRRSMSKVLVSSIRRSIEQPEKEITCILLQCKFYMEIHRATREGMHSYVFFHS